MKRQIGRFIFFIFKSLEGVYPSKSRSFAIAQDDMVGVILQSLLTKSSGGVLLPTKNPAVCLCGVILQYSPCVSKCETEESHTFLFVIQE